MWRVRLVPRARRRGDRMNFPNRLQLVALRGLGVAGTGRLESWNGRRVIPMLVRYAQRAGHAP
jgi:hypothetical protein